MDNLACPVYFVEMRFVPEHGRFSISSLFVEMHFVPENGRLSMSSLFCRNALCSRKWTI